MQIKMLKLLDDPCYGLKYKQIEQCEACWIEDACHMRYKNFKAKEQKP